MKRYFLKYNEFLNEALPLSFAKKVNEVPRKKTVDQILNQAFPQKERVYVDLPKEAVERFNGLVVQECKSYEPIKTFLDEQGITIIDFVNNVAKEPNQKNFTKITKVLSKLDHEDLVTLFIKDFLRIDLSKNKEQTYKVVISKAKYDIAGMSTDRAWSSCMKLNVKDLKSLGSRGSGSGEYSSYVKNDIEEGTIIAYLIAGNDTNINKPFGRVLIKPYVNEERTLWYPDTLCYGNILKVDGEFQTIFKKVVKEWVDTNINSIAIKGLEDGTTFKRNKNLYNDSSQEEIEYTDGKIGTPLQKIEKWEDGTIKSIKNYNEVGDLHGQYKKWHSNGKPMVEATYKNGKYHGQFKGWYSNGQPEIEATYKDGEYHGQYKKWYDNGQPEIEATYKDDKKHGQYKKWHDNGQPEIEATYKNGQLHGQYKRWYSNGQIDVETTYKDGQLDGQYKEWDSDGQPEIEATFKDGIEI